MRRIVVLGGFAAVATLLLCLYKRRSRFNPTENVLEHRHIVRGSLPPDNIPTAQTTHAKEALSHVLARLQHENPGISSHDLVQLYYRWEQ
jgi:hypothetical protein